jgi:peptidoglycan/xylan/chitin deacetylase (PgdA/CDA1 family)
MKSLALGMAGRWRLRSAIGGKPLILMYHGVSDSEAMGLSGRTGKHVNKDRFAKQLKAVARYYKVVSLSDLVEEVERGKGNGIVAITFDDGYLNNFSVAAPILEDLRIPATFFVSTGYIGTGRWMWVDRLEYALDCARKNQLAGIPIMEGGSVKTLVQKERALGMIKATLKQMALREAENYVGRLEEAMAAEVGLPRGNYEFMGWMEVESLANAGFAIGGHTVNHPILSRIGIDEAKREIDECIEEIKGRVGYCSNVFCYPNGKKQDYSEEILQYCRERFRAALSTNVGFARMSELHELRRIGVNDFMPPGLLLWRMSKFLRSGGAT